MIQIEGLTFRYPGSATPAVEDLSIHVGDGMVYGLLGPNGSGKTTLISLIMGLMQPASGKLLIAPDTSTGKPPRVAFVPQEYAFYPRLSVSENLRFFAGVSRVPASSRQEHMAEAIEATALGEVLHTRAARLSGGLKRRLNLAIGLVNRPQLLLLDEPTVGIDPHSRHFILDSIRAIHEAGTTIIYTSHYMEEVEALCDEIGVLDRGKLIANGGLHELLERDEAGHLRVHVQDTIDADWLASVPGATLVDGELHVAPCVATDVPDLLTALRARDIRYTQVRYAQQNLEDLFLHLTGRQLRD